MVGRRADSATARAATRDVLLGELRDRRLEELHEAAEHRRIAPHQALGAPVLEGEGNFVDHSKSIAFLVQEHEL